LVTGFRPLASCYAAMQRTVSSAEDLAIKTNTSIVVCVDGREVRLTAQDLIKMREHSATDSQG